MLQRVFIDTNCFLHLRDLADLPWSELFPGADLEILVAPVVVDELDRLKTEREGRIRDRSRAALNRIVAASAEPEMRLLLRKRPRAIWLAMAKAPRVDWSAYPRLDPTRADDQLVAAALSEPGADPTALLSFDAGPLIRARAVGLTAHSSPEAWALPLQRDRADQERARLERELAEARETRPSLIARFLDTDEAGELRLLIPDLPMLPASMQDRLMSEVRARWPIDRIWNSCV